jgi:hypothetical protein
MPKGLAVALLIALMTAGHCAHAQLEGPQRTQILVGVDAKSGAPANASALTVEVNDRKEALKAWEPLTPGDAQVALLIDDGLRGSIGRELDTLKSFVNSLPPGVEVMVGFMQFGRVVAEQEFTTDHAQAAASIHLPQGVPGSSASPYLCLSDFVKRWPGKDETPAGMGAAAVGGARGRKARMVLMLTNGVDPYNGSTSVMNQGSPYVDAAIADAQRAGVAVYSIYYGDAGIRGPSADNSGQSYLAELTQKTGGVNYWEGVGNPVSLEPFLKRFQRTLTETYIATFDAPAGKDPKRDMVRIKISAPKAKLHAPAEVLPGNKE